MGDAKRMEEIEDNVQRRIKMAVKDSQPSMLQMTRGVLAEALRMELIRKLYTHSYVTLSPTGFDKWEIFSYGDSWYGGKNLNELLLAYAKDRHKDIYEQLIQLGKED